MHTFLRKILDATHLTRNGKLVEATAALQRALASSAPKGASSAENPERSLATATVEDTPIGERPADAADVVAVLEEQKAAPVVTDRAVAGRSQVDSAVVEDAPRVERARTGPGRFYESSFTGVGGTRAFKLFVPAGFEGEALPLVVMLHGCTQNPDDFAAGTRMNALAQERGFIVLYPAQAPRSNAQRCWNWFLPQHQRRGAGEPALLAGMTRHVVQTNGVDADRVYVAGLSAGGAMAAILAREYPDVFAAAGVHSGVAPGSARDVASAFAVMKSGPGAANELAVSFLGGTAAAAPGVAGVSRPLIVFHGDADTTVAAANGAAVVAAALGAGGAVATTSDGTAVSGRAYRRTVWQRNDGTGDAATDAEHWVVRGSAHAWSGGDASGSYTDPAGPDASREMLRFFLAHPRRAGSSSDR